MSMQRCCPPARVPNLELTEEAALFKALGDPYRLLILATIAQAEDEVCVCDFTAGLPLEQPTVSHHLKILRDVGLVTCERRGTWVYYTLASGVRQRVAETLKGVLSQKVKA
jgi:DNA-binding transcriptional ArsR family regulator